MKNANFKSLLKEWSAFLLNESSAERVKQMIDHLEKFGSKIIISEKDENSITIEYKLTSDRLLHGSINCRSSKGVGLDAAETKGIGQGEVNPTWYVTLTRATTDGMGPLLYEVLIEYISSRKNAALKPDFGSVSDEARSVWEKFDDRHDIEKIQLDVDNYTLRRNQIRGGNIEQLTPNNSKDDTKQTSAIHDKGTDDWSSSALSRAYKKDSTPLITILEKRELIDMPKVFKSKKGSAWG